MPTITVTSEPKDAGGAKITLEERVAPDNLKSEHYSAQLMERVGWAVIDAKEAERPMSIER